MLTIRINSNKMPDVIYNANSRSIWLISDNVRVAFSDERILFLSNDKEFDYKYTSQYEDLIKWIAVNTLPSHLIGYPETQVKDILLKIGYNEKDFWNWMRGQTVSVSDIGEKIVYPYDFHNFIQNGIKATITD